MKITRTSAFQTTVLYLAALSLIFAYAVFQAGGTIKAEWEHCMIGVGLLLLVYFRYTKESDLAPSPEWWLWWPFPLLIGYILLQLVPLPAPVLNIISPTRATLLQSLNGISPGIRYAPISVFPAGSLAQFLRVASYVVVFVLARELAWKIRHRRWIVVAPFVTIAATEALLGLFQYDASTGAAARGTYGNQNHFAGLLELSLPFAVTYVIVVLDSARVRSLRQALLASMAVMASTLILIGILFSMSRMAFVAALTSLFVVGSLALAVRKSVLRWWIAPGLLGITLVAGFVYLSPEALIGRFSQIVASEGVPADVRFHVWSDTERLVADYPVVGTGLGTFEQAFNKYKTVSPQIAIDSPHNDYLQILVELGTIGFAVAMLAMLSLLVAAGRATFRSVDPTVRYLAIACFGALVAILLHSFTDLNLYIPANGMLVAWIAGVVASLSLSSKKLAEEGLRKEKNEGA